MTTTLGRTDQAYWIQNQLKHYPVVAILGPRQCGKTTLALQISHAERFDLENPRDLARLDQPQMALESLSGVVIIDEIQRKPELFPLLRYLVDNKKKLKFLILGSASRDLISQSSESLAGRIHYHELGGFGINEVKLAQHRRLWVRGAFPRSFLASSEQVSRQWREDYVSTFLERDVPQLGIRIPAATLRRFWTMVSHYHGQIVNYAEIGRSFGISDMSIRHYIEILEGTFMVRVLKPWHVNTAKRLVKRPKIYLRDSGIFHTLQGIADERTLRTHPKLGASWEGFALDNLCRVLKLPAENTYFWATHAGAEVDLFWQAGGKNFAAEFKFTDAPKRTPSMLQALKDLKLHHLYVIYPGDQAYDLDRKISVLPLEKIRSLVK